MKASAKKSAKKAPGAVIDPYLPTSGNFGYRVARYDLDLEYKVAINRLSGSATITAVTLTRLRTFTLDLSPVLIVGKMLVNGKRPAHFGCYGGKLHVGLASALPAGAELTIVVRYGGSPRPIRSLWGDIGSKSCLTACWWPANPTAPPRGFPATTIPVLRPATASGSAPKARTR